MKTRKGEKGKKGKKGIIKLTTKKSKRKNKTLKHITCGEPLIEIVRNNTVESIHSGHLIILDSKGKSILSLGKSDFIMYPRSAIKAIQASGMVRNGLGSIFDDDSNDELLALVCSSHIGSQEHQNNVKRILAKVGLNEAALQNTPFLPMITDEAFNSNMKIEPTSLAAPCSGKHAGMIATAKINNLDITTYKDPNHPVQIACKKELEMLSGELITNIAVDGCGAPLFGITLKGLSRAIHNLMISQDPVHQRVVNACKSFPIMVSGTGTLPTVSMQSVPGLFMKSGAEAVVVAGLPSGETIVWKMSDGIDRGEGHLLKASLNYIGLDMPNFNTSEDRDIIIRATLTRASVSRAEAPRAPL